MRRIAGLAAALVVVAAAIALVAIIVPFAIADRIWMAMAQGAATATGTRIAAEGPVRLKLFPVPRLLASSVEIANTAGAPLVHVDRVRLDFGWTDLLAGRPRARRAELRHTRFLTLPQHPPADVELAGDGTGATVAASFEGGTLRSRVRGDASRIEIEAFTLVVGAYTTVGTGTMTRGDEPRLVVAFDRVDDGMASVGKGAVAAVWGSDGVVIERLMFQHANGGEAVFFGLATVDHGAVRLEGGLEGRLPTASGPAEGTARLAASLGAAVGRAELNDIELRTPESRLSGSLRGELTAEPSLAADLRLDRLRLGDGSSPPPGLLAALAAVPKAELRLRVGRIQWPGASAEGVVLDAVRQGPQVTIREVAARDVGGAPFHAQGRFALAAAEPQVSFENVTFRYATLSGKARGSVDMAGTVPRLRMAAALDGPLALDAVVPPLPPLPPAPMTRRAAAAAATAPRQTAATSGWSREQFAFPVLPPVVAEIHVTAPRLLWRGLRLDQADLNARLGDGAVVIDTLAGQLYGGRFELRGRASTRDANPTFIGSVTLAGGDLKAVLRDYAGVAEVAGSVDSSAELSATGGSPAELVAGLKGTVQVRCRGGTIEGFNLPGMSEGLKKLQRPTDLAEVFRLGLGGGRTPFSALDGAFRIERGIARTENLHLVARGGEVRTVGQVNLATWSLDMTYQFRLTEHPDLPPFGLKISGSMATPRRIFDFQDLQSQLVRRGRPPAR